VVRQPLRRRLRVAALSLALGLPSAGLADNSAPATIARVKASIVAVGTFERLRNPQFSFAGTGFVVGDGLRIATNEHVLPKALDAERNETLAIAVRAGDGAVQIRPARKLAVDSAHDLALLELQGAPLPALRLGDSERVREGETYLLTGYPGNSGSPVYHPESGVVIGIVNSVLVKSTRESALAQPSGITYAIPAQKLLELLNQGR
jgi:serine protease Do